MPSWDDCGPVRFLDQGLLAGWEVAVPQATIPRVWSRMAHLTAHLIGHTRPSRVTAGHSRGNHNNHTTRGGQGASWTGREAGYRKASLSPPLPDPWNPHPLAADRWDTSRQRGLLSSTERTPLERPDLTTGAADAAVVHHSHQPITRRAVSIVKPQPAQPYRFRPQPARQPPLPP